MDRTALGSVLFATLVVIGMAVPSMALSTNTGEPSTSNLTGTSPVMIGQTNSATQTAQADSRVNARVGPQLSTVIDISSDEVQTDFDNTAFELSVEGASEEAQAEVIAERASELRDRAESIHDDFEEATEAYEEGDLTTSEYAQRLAVLNARATNLLNSFEQLRQRATNVSALDLEAAGLSQSALDRSVENLSSVTGTGARALLKQFTGESDGEIELETENGLSIEVESEDGEQSREFERPRDDTDTVTVSQSVALETARGALSSVGGDWALTGSEVDEDDGVYEFAFMLRNVSNVTGEAEISVDGSSGDIFSLEEEIEPREEGGEATDEGDDADRGLTMVVVEGTPGPNERITVQVLANGEPAGNVAVYLNDRPVGTTGNDGRLTVALPAADEAELTAETDDDDAELEFEFEDAEEDEQEQESESASEPEDDDEELESESASEPEDDNEELESEPASEPEDDDEELESEPASEPEDENEEPETPNDEREDGDEREEEEETESES
jgi:hypothetical protein